MNDYLQELERELRDAAARRYPSGQGSSDPGPGRSRRLGRWRLVGRWWQSPLSVLAVLLVGGSAAAAVLVLSRGSAPLTGSVPGSRGALRYDIPLTPDLEPGHAGWCSYPSFVVTGTIAGSDGGVCAPAPVPDAAVILGGAEPVSNLRSQSSERVGTGPRNVSLFWTIVAARVAAIKLSRGGVLIAPRPDRRLPAGWRAAVAFTTLPPQRIQPLVVDRTGAPVITPQLPAGLINQATSAFAPARTQVPGSRSTAPCSIPRTRIAGVTSQWEIVATRVPALGHAIKADSLFSCARSWFSIKGQGTAPSAAILLNANSPNDTAPTIPGLQPTGRPGVYENPSAEIVARRVGITWLIVQDDSLAFAARLLAAIHPTGPAIGQ